MPDELTDFPVVDVKSWKKGLCKDELGLFPMQVACVVATMVAELHGQFATAQWICDLTGAPNGGLSVLARGHWVESIGRVAHQEKVWRATERAWRSLGFVALSLERERLDEDALTAEARSRRSVVSLARGAAHAARSHAAAGIRNDARGSR